MKVAIVCDWLTNVGGAEKVLLATHRLYPEAPIYTSKYDKKGIDWFDDADVRTGWLQIFPASWRRVLGPFRQRWFSHLDLSGYDLVISVTGAEAKAVKAPDGVHISYCHVPTQYYWQMYDDYVKNPGFGILNPVVRFCFKALVRPLKKADYRSAQGVDQFVTISEYAKELIRKYYKREAVVVHPPVEVEDFRVKKGGMSSAKDYYVIVSRQVTWKRLDLAVKACLELGRKLILIGEGPEHERLVKMAGESNLVEFVPVTRKEKLAGYLQGAKGYLFPSLEPFGIAPVEALSCGCPVIAFGEGGARDYVIDNVNGVLFGKQTVKSLVEGIRKFEKMKFDAKQVAKTAESFGVKRFDLEMRQVVRENLK